MKKVLLLLLPVLLCTMLAFPVSAAPDLENGLVLYYNFDNDSGTAVADKSPTGLNAEATGVTFTAGKVGKAAVFNGTDSVIKFTNPEAFTDISFSLWLKVEDLAKDGGQIIAGYEWVNGSIHTSYSKEGFISFGICEWKNATPKNDRREDAASYIMSGIDAFNGKWVHAVFSYDNATKVRKLYINGVFMYESTAVTAPANLFKGLYELGCYSPDTGGQGRHFNGLMDEFRVYNRVLSEEEAVALSAQGGGVEVPLTAPTATPEPTQAPTKKPTPTPTAPVTKAPTQSAAVIPSGTEAPKPEPGNSWVIWVVAAGAVAGGVVAYFLLKKKK